MNAQHTPGPWYVRDRHPGRATFNIGTDPNEAYSGEVAVIFRTGSLPVHDANARLIAAAPDMLAMLRQIAGECAECGGSAEKVRANGPAPEDEYAEPCPDCHDIRAVINKAEGRS